ncbi:Viral A-type inclusion protein [Trypanosoma rangeli]|uniref:Viral A-type inclusion protein n=1 Tax=Trypanosoma rangeli TaxID=5698 RepID=A0A3R7KN13_TRYRA|nr:Viral A-type inclusion protein [Trypanosoma rangeli]RNE97828.1 Viral A-type inclusion protein [Trypanosoma rangeli]|eukprot:RNE97828.1 Viral A-type inclusion protein [Trypanosoma rangeli]
MARVADTAGPLLPQLLAENARLKAKVGVPESERVLQHVLQDQLRRFFDDARRTLEDAMSQAVVLGSGSAEGVAEAEAGKGGTQRVSALVEALRVLGEQNEGMLRQMSEMQTGCVAELNGKVEALARERDALRQRVLQLEEEAAGADEQPSSLLTELRHLRASDTLLRQQVEALRQRTEAATSEANKLVTDGLHGALKLPRLLEQLEEMRTRLHQAEAERELFRLQLEESQGRSGLRHALREAQLADEVALGQSTVRELRTRVAALEAREKAAEVHKATIAQLEATVQALQARHAAPDEAPVSKRRRLETENSDDPDSVRREFITFWYEGREELRRLREKERVLRSTQEKLTQMERTRSTVTRKLVTLADEIGRVREENQSLRAQCVGLEVERDYLRGSLASVISHHMQEEELRQCSAAIRDAAVKAAAVSLSVVADPQAIQQALRQSQELKNEVAQLSKQREKLHRYIALQEERITALITHGAVLESEGAQAHITTTGGGDGGSSMVQTVHRAEMQALDVLAGLGEEASAHTEGGMRRQATFLSMQQRIEVCERQLVAHQQQLSDVSGERDDARHQLDAMQAEMRSTLAAREAAMSELLNSNATLMHSTETLRSENQQVRASYEASVMFSQELLTALVGLLEVLRAEMSFVASLNTMLTAERSELVELTRRSAEAWNAHEGEVQEVVEAVERMCGYILQAVEQQQRTHALQETAHLLHLTEALKRQEKQVTETQATFTQACRELAEGLAQRITAAQHSADVLWKKRTMTLLEERQHLQAQLGAEKELLARIERSLVVPPTSSASSTGASGTKTTTTTPSSMTAPSAAADESRGSRDHVLEAINQFLALSSPHVTAAVETEEEHEEPAEGEEQGDGELLHDLPVAAAATTESTGAPQGAEEDEVGEKLQVEEAEREEAADATQPA